jgi:hypothetical protein
MERRIQTEDIDRTEALERHILEALGVQGAADQQRA